MLTFLLDEQISHVVMEHIREKRPDIGIESVLLWRGGDLRGREDEVVLMAARSERFTLVTYDQKTIVPLIVQWAAEGQDHAGVVLVDEKTIAQGDIGGQVRALLRLWDRDNALDWTNVVTYLLISR